MHCTIRNLTDRPVLLRFNSGQTHHIGGGTELADVLPVEVRDNARLKRLEERGVIRISAATAEGEASEAIAERGKKKGKRD